MTRFHVHVSVTDFSQSIGFYSNLFGNEPAVTKTFRTLGNIPVFGSPAVKLEPSSASRAPKVSSIPVKVQSPSCG